MHKIDLNYLKYFYYVVKNNGFTRASEVLNIKQPVISRAVKLLEDQIGRKLIERQRKQVLLTAYGKEVFHYADQIFKNVQLINQFISEPQEHQVKEISFATSDALSVEMIGRVIAKFHQKYPLIKVTHYSGPSKLYLNDISKGLIDFGVFFNVAELTADLVKTKLTACDFIYVCHNQYLNQNKNNLIHFIATKNENQKLPLFEKYKQISSKAEIVLTSNSTVARKNMVENSLGVSVLPTFLVSDLIKKGNLKQIGKDVMSLPLYYIERESSYRFKYKTDLLEILKNEI